MKVKVKKLGPEGVIPKYAKDGDAGLDLVATSRRMDKSGFIEYGTSLAFEIPEGHVGLIFPRSSISKVNMSLTNAVGVVDSGYRGEVRFRFKPSGVGKGLYEVGDRIGQLVVMPYPKIDLVVVDELDDSERGEGGFGSTNIAIPKPQYTEAQLDAEQTRINGAGLVEKYTLREEIG